MLATINWFDLKDAQVREPNTVLATLVRSSFDRVKLLGDVRQASSIV